MYFKSLELYGFKSFAGKTKIDFESGVTAIVGPNGCGKSNIVDSLKWVLGEQSAKDLRGVNMEDVIFNGTDNRDPVGFAEVSLVMSNESKFLPIEYDEVIITRRLFRSGESEYLLNKNQVRLKDIIELFMGTGVGTSAYSIIEQGKIDMIISSKPEDRRYIFEEASGIIKYKSKKREAIRKLEYTENNLLRINDIMLEVKRQIGSIERQAKKAERYKEEFEKLKDLDTKAAFREYKGLLAEKETLEGSIQEYKNNEGQLAVDVAQLSAELARLKSQQAQVENELSEVRFKEFNLNSTIERSSDKINLNNERFAELESLKSALLNEQTSIQKNISELQETVLSLSKETESVSGNRAQKESLLNERELQLRELEAAIKQNEDNIRNGKLKLVDVLALHSKTKNDLAKLSSDISNSQSRLRRLKSEEEKDASEESDVNSRFSQIEKEVSDLEASLKNKAASKVSLEEVISQKNDEMTDAEKRTADLESKRMSLESRLSLLEDMIRRYEGFGGGAKAILIEKREKRLNIPGVYGAIAELINVKRDYEAAVEAALGDLLQCVVVENASAARDLINYLKQKNLGKVTVVSLDSIMPPDQEKRDFGAQDGMVGPLANFVESDGQFKNLFSALFNNVYLVKDLDTLLNSKTGKQRNIKFVTLAGEVMENAFLTGGSVSENADAGILNRKIQIREIESQLGQIKTESVNLSSRKESLTSEVNTLLERLNGEGTALRQCELELANKKSQKDSISALMKKITDELALLRLELEEVEEEINSLRTKQTADETELKKLDNENSAVQNLIASAQVFIEGALKQKENLVIDVTRVRTELAAVSEQEKNFSQNLKMRSDFLASQKELLSEKQKSFNESASRQEELKNEINTLQGAIKEAGAGKETITLQFKDVRNKKTELESLINRAEGEFKNKEELLSGIKDKLHGSHMGLQENSFKIETLKTRVSQAYKVEIDQANPELSPETDWVVVTNEINELRQKIEKMGPVNLVAIEEHQELKERSEFLTKQQEDLVSAKESLMEAIRKINKTTRELFMDTFEKVRVEFKEYFKYLFGGGQAELVLMDEQDILECGIEIMARPPGKKLQSISLLSGGEKALTAISLLFSIFKIKPSPFCILDEVDAPLDESNIGRFSKMLSEFTKTSQFIIITHNKKTISIADVMYGITMEQSGVSKVVSVKFAKDKHSPQIEKPKPVASASPS